VIISKSVFSVPSKQCAILKNIPMALLDKTKEKLKKDNIKFRVRYRGPRNTCKQDHRDSFAKQHECLKEFANRFSVYRVF
jgi:hypothetical protein